MTSEDVGSAVRFPNARSCTRSLAAGLLGVSALLLCACATQRLDQYSAFATAGTTYVANFHQVTAQAGSAMIAVDSVVMATVHRNVGSDVERNPDKYSTELVKHDQLLQTHLAVLQLIDTHATLLGSYFNAITKLTDSKTATATSAAATDLLKSIEGFDASLAKATLGGTPREAYLRASVSLNTVDSAQTAIKQLHVTFKQLVENKSGPIDLQTLIKDITDMVAYANAAESTLKTSPAK